jgi:ABC-type tungstate transport system permease subunit
MLVITSDFQVRGDKAALTGCGVIAAIVFAGEKPGFDLTVSPRLEKYKDQPQLEVFLRASAR